MCCGTMPKDTIPFQAQLLSHLQVPAQEGSNHQCGYACGEEVSPCQGSAFPLLGQASWEKLKEYKQ